MKLSIKIIPLGFIIFLLFAGSTFADPIYKSTDKKGVPVYSSKPKDSKAELAKLPNIVKEPMDQGKIKPAVISCAGHGGVNCQAGADGDGSVICYDNFKNSIQRFAVSCSAAKLAIIPESYKSGVSNFSLVVRNTSAVAAKSVKVQSDKGLLLEGPSELEAYGSADYSSKKPPEHNAKFQVSCENCP